MISLFPVKRQDRTGWNSVTSMHVRVCIVASRDVVRDVKLTVFPEDPNHSKANTKSFSYHISWAKPRQPNGLIYFYVVSIGQDSLNGPKEERCVGHDTYAINVTLLPRTAYRLRIITYTIARLDNEYKDRSLINDGQYTENGTSLFFQTRFITDDLPSECDTCLRRKHAACSLSNVR